MRVLIVVAAVVVLMIITFMWRTDNPAVPDASGTTGSTRVPS
jgi:hypothetical protein